MSQQKPRKLKSAEYAEAVALVAAGARLEMTWEQIAKEVGVSKPTILGWQKDPEFWREVREAMPGEMQAAIPEALAAIRRELKSSKGATAIKAAELLLRAAGMIVDRTETRSEAVVAQLPPDAVAAVDAALDKIVGVLPPTQDIVEDDVETPQDIVDED